MAFSAALLSMGTAPSSRKVAQCVAPMSSWRSTRGRLAGGAWRTDLPLTAGAAPPGATEGTNAESLAALRQAVVMAAARRGRFEVWVTHMFVLADLVSTNTASGEGLVSKADAAGAIQVLARLPAA